MKKIIVLTLSMCILTACQESLEDQCERECREYTEKKCPTSLDQSLRIDSMTFDRSSHTITYHYTLLGDLDNQDVIDAGRDSFTAKLRNDLKNTTNMRAYKAEGYNFSYVYYSDKEKKRCRLSVLFTEKDYKK